METDTQVPDNEKLCDDPQTFEERIFSASVVHWDRTSKNPVGRLREFEGKIGDIASETEALLIEWGVDERPFNEAANQCLPPCGPGNPSSAMRASEM